MNKYQLLFIIDNEVSENEKSSIVEKFTGLIGSLGGVVDAVDKWGTRKFAYVMEHKTEGYYVLVKFSADATVPSEIDRQMKINDKIIRQMITRI